MYNEGMNIEYIKIWHEGQISKFKSGLISSRQFQLMLSCANLFLCIQMHNYFPCEGGSEEGIFKRGQLHTCSVLWYDHNVSVYIYYGV